MQKSPQKLVELISLRNLFSEVSSSQTLPLQDMLFSSSIGVLHLRFLSQGQFDCSVLPYKRNLGLSRHAIKFVDRATNEEKHTFFRFLLIFYPCMQYILTEVELKASTFSQKRRMLETLVFVFLRQTLVSFEEIKRRDARLVSRMFIITIFNK